MTQRTSTEIIKELRLYNKDWALAHEAADRIEALETQIKQVTEKLVEASWAIDSRATGNC